MSDMSILAVDVKQNCVSLCNKKEILGFSHVHGTVYSHVCYNNPHSNNNRAVVEQSVTVQGLRARSHNNDQE